MKKEMKRDFLLDVARTSLQTKVRAKLAAVLTEVCDYIYVFRESIA